MKRKNSPNEKVKQSRIKTGLTQSEVAKICGITLRQYQRLENGESSLKSTSLKVGIKICDLLNLDVHDLIK